ncbi:MAG: TatD family hydrolase [Candidatus Latescibacteria bacterium]|nr:TatD family hydrolase [Candidatus Latescibacterota bacterium]
MLIDTHAHLDDPRFKQDRDVVIRRAFAAGIEAIVNVGTDLSTSRASVTLSEQYDRVYAAVGCHPHDADTLSPDGLSQLAELTRGDKVVAIGETGLDFYRDRSPRDVQRWAFCDQIRLARTCRLPLIVHSRSADEETMRILHVEGAAEVGGVLHCFPGDMDLARRAIRMNFHIGLGGTTTFKNSSSLTVARQIPLEWMLLETDCPYLAPMPHRGKRNEPAYVRFAAQRIASERGISLDTLAEATGENARRLFGLDW